MGIGLCRTPVKYGSELKKLVGYHTGKPYAVRFMMEMWRGSDPRRARIRALKATDVVTHQPIVASLDPIAFVRWESAGYARVMAVDVTADTVIFQLTELGIEAARAGDRQATGERESSTWRLSSTPTT